MRFSVRWLQNYLDQTLTVDELTRHLTMLGLEVENVIDLGLISGKVQVGEILKIHPIEGADKIRLTEVMVDEREPLKIVCGAKNISEGDRVPVARFGFTMLGPDGETIELKPRKIMGIEGAGMLCSTRELGVAEDHEGIWLLAEDAPVSEPYDALVEIAITPNRPDALSMVGIARDLAAKLGSRVKMPEIRLSETEEKIESTAKVSIQAKDDCPRYCARVIKDVEIKPSPRWMQVVLQSAGLRPINNIVDITNYVLLELGHPLHAFDLDTLEGRQIVVRHPNHDEKEFVTLDDKARKLEEDDLLICDGAKPVALAGIMGGANTEVTANTKNILLEAAYFKPTTIRRTRRRLDLNTDASYRFERGTDPKKLTIAMNRAAQLMVELANGKLCRGFLDVLGNLPEQPQLTIRLARVKRLLGKEISGRQISEILKPLGFEVLRAENESILVEVPSHRSDITLEVDVIEEIARIIGYEKFEEASYNLPVVHKERPGDEALENQLRDAALSLGMSEAINFSFLSESSNRMVGVADSSQVTLLNPLSPEMSVMRRSMLPSLLQNVERNLNNYVEDIRLFEIGKTYEYEEEASTDGDPRTLRTPAKETTYLSAVLCGNRRNWRDGQKSYDFFDLKGLTEAMLFAAGVDKLVVEKAPESNILHPGRCARFLSKGEIVATFGQVHPSLLKDLDIKKPVFYLEIPLTGLLLEATAKISKFRELHRFPPSTRDIAVVVDKDVASLDLERTIRSAGGQLLTNVALFDIFEGEQIGAGKKSLAYSLTYRHLERTLTDAEVNEAHQKVLEAIEKKHGAKLR